MSRVPAAWIVCGLAYAVGLLGCGGESVPPVYPVRGQLLLDGKPLEGALVAFHPQIAERRSLTTMTDAAGRFQLTTHSPGDGAEAGAYRVTVEYRELVQEGDDKVRSGRNLLPARYARPETSELQCEVQAGENELPPLAIRSR